MNEEEGVKIAVVQPPGEITQAPAPRWSDEQLGLTDEQGQPLPPDVRASRYGIRDIVGWQFAVTLGEKVGLEGPALFDLARQYHAVRPESWREELLEALTARIGAKPPGIFDRERNLVAYEESLWAELGALANTVRAEVRVKALASLVERLRTGIAKAEWRN